ncbi:MAG: type II toxin-antitoxin system RelB/DinJ family antitoxin [Bauldia sp.]
MAATSVVRARIDEKTKRKASKALAGMGLSMSDAIRLMLIRVAEEKALPFDVYEPNEETIAAMKEAERGGLRSFDTVEELLAELNEAD